MRRRLMVPSGRRLESPIAETNVRASLVVHGIAGFAGLVVPILGGKQMMMMVKINGGGDLFFYF